MNRIVIIFLLLLLSTSLFAEDRNLVDEKNQYLGETYEIILAADENEYFKRVIQYYDDSSHLLQMDHYFNDASVANNGMLIQKNYYDSNKQCFKYELNFDNNVVATRGYDKIIEYVDSSDNVTKLEWFSNGRKIDYLEDITISDNFPFYTLAFLQTVMFEGHEAESEKDVYSYSARYKGIRSVIKCTDEIASIDQSDIEILNRYGRFIQIEEFEKYFGKKMIVKEGSEEYIMFAPESLIEKMSPGSDYTVRYYVFGLNGKLYLSGFNILPL